MTDHGTPEGYTSLTPFLCVADGAAAITFYTEVFGASLVSKMELPTGGIAHAELQFASGRLQLADAMAEYELAAPDGGPVDNHSIAFYCPDTDAVFERAVAAGATVREPPSTFVTGDRFASVRDPYGHRWTIMTRVEEVSAEEGERRLAEWSASSLS